MRRNHLFICLMPAVAALVTLTGCQSYPTVVWADRGAPAAQPAAFTPPEPQPIAQTGYAEPSNGYLKQGPVVAGAMLTPAQKLASEAAVELQKENETLKTEKKQLDERVAQLSKDLELNQQALTQATGEMEKAQKELISTRTELQGWQHQLATMYSGFRTSEQQQSKTLQEMEQEIQRLIQSQQKSATTSDDVDHTPSEKSEPEKFESVENATPAPSEKPTTASGPALPKR